MSGYEFPVSAFCKSKRAGPAETRTIKSSAGIIGGPLFMKARVTPRSPKHITSSVQFFFGSLVVDYLWLWFGGFWLSLDDQRPEGPRTTALALLTRNRFRRLTRPRKRCSFRSFKILETLEATARAYQRSPREQIVPDFIPGYYFKVF